MHDAGARDLEVGDLTVLSWTTAMSISTPGSTNGKYDGRKRRPMSSRSKNARQNCVIVPLRSARLMPSSTQSASIWWNIGECVASWSWR
jgi:hypothetical protein